MSNSSIPETLTFPTDASHATHLEPRSRLTPHRPCNPQVLFPDSALCPYVEARPVPERFRPSVRSSGRMLTLAVVSIQEWEIVNERTDCREAASLKQVERERVNSRVPRPPRPMWRSWSTVANSLFLPLELPYH